MPRINGGTTNDLMYSGLGSINQESVGQGSVNLNIEKDLHALDL